MSDRTIHTIPDLVTALEQATGESGYLLVLDKVVIPAEEFEPYCTWNDKRYTRNCLARTDAFELLLICYEPGQQTSIHDFATEEAWIHPVKGAVTEERYEPIAGGQLRKVSAAKLDEDSFSYLHNGRSIHRYINSGEERAITLNLYARPLRTWKVYDERTGDPTVRPAGA
jgi:cysteine dioxygenase